MLNKGNTHEQILNILKERGYDGSRSLISSYINKNDLRKNIRTEKNAVVEAKQKDKNISIHLATKLICKNNKNLTKDEFNLLDKLKENYHELIDLKKLIDNENKLSLEGMVNKVKGIKRMSYGRCKFDLFRIKIFEEIA